MLVAVATSADNPLGAAGGCGRGGGTSPFCAAT